MKTKYIIFDLDDTLLYEIDYLKSAYQEISKFLDGNNHDVLFHTMFEKYKNKENVFEYLTEIYHYPKEKLLEIYRNHFPTIVLNDGAKHILNVIKSKGYKLGLITDGRSITQRNKLKALQIEDLFDKIIVSEEFGSTKPDERNFKIFLENDIDEYYYIADNTKKDFITPNKLGWTTICLLDKGYNIHSQTFEIDNDFLPQIKVDFFEEIRDVIFNTN